MFTFVVVPFLFILFILFIALIFRSSSGLMTKLFFTSLLLLIFSSVLLVALMEG